MEKLTSTKGYPNLQKVLIGFFALLLILSLSSCIDVDPNLNEKGEDVIEAQATHSDPGRLVYRDTVYVPIYSDIYSESKEFRLNLTATLSIRNTSFTDSLFIQDIDYYNTDGDLVRKYLQGTLSLKPMQSIEYVIEEKDTQGGTGANFIINWGARSSAMRPVIQGVMISTNGQQGISFVTEGISLKTTF